MVATVMMVLLAYSTPTAAHGIEVSAEIDDTVATLELTDETGEVCITVDPEPERTAVFAIVDSDDDVQIILGEGFGTLPACQFFDVDVVNAILDDVDAHRLVIAFGQTERSGVLRKPALPDTETATGDGVENDQGPNVPVIFAGGMALGLGVVFVRKRFFSRGPQS